MENAFLDYSKHLSLREVIRKLVAILGVYSNLCSTKNFKHVHFSLYLQQILGFLIEFFVINTFIFLKKTCKTFLQIKHKVLEKIIPQNRTSHMSCSICHYHSMFLSNRHHCSMFLQTDNKCQCHIALGMEHTAHCCCTAGLVGSTMSHIGLDLRNKVHIADSTSNTDPMGNSCHEYCSTVEDCSNQCWNTFGHRSSMMDLCLNRTSFHQMYSSDWQNRSGHYHNIHYHMGSGRIHIAL